VDWIYSSDQKTGQEYIIMAVNNPSKAITSKINLTVNTYVCTLTRRFGLKLAKEN